MPVIVIGGPTASGKTKLAVEVANALDTEIISGDSIQIYRHLNIGSAKPTREEMGGITHHMIDFLEPDVRFSAADFVEMGRKYIGQISEKGKIPVIVGGTGLYISSLLDGVEFIQNAPANPALRERLSEEAKKWGGEALHQRLKMIDPMSADKISPNDTKRIIRAIEIYETTGKTKSEHDTQKKESPYQPFLFLIDYPRFELYERINLRVDLMFEAGLISEVQNILKLGYNPRCPAMQAIGYKETVDYLRGLCTLEETKEIIKRSTRRYAKRQLTWFNRDSRVVRLNPYQNDLCGNILKLVKNCLYRDLK
jgi:tRNA dimethylallyltransferase